MGDLALFVVCCLFFVLVCVAFHSQRKARRETLICPHQADLANSAPFLFHRSRNVEYFFSKCKVKKPKNTLHTLCVLLLPSIFSIHAFLPRDKSTIEQSSYCGRCPGTPGLYRGDGISSGIPNFFLRIFDA